MGKFRNGWEPLHNASTVRRMVDISKPPLSRKYLEREGIKERLINFYFSHYDWQIKSKENNKNNNNKNK